jgi:integration host factor subunit alpha
MQEKGEKMTEKKKTLVRSDIAEAIHQTLGFSHADAFKMIEKTFSIITAELATRRSVKISGFATLEPYLKKERIGRNPKTGKEYPISQRTVLSFKPSPALKNNKK